MSETKTVTNMLADRQIADTKLTQLDIRMGKSSFKFTDSVGYLGVNMSLCYESGLLSVIKAYSTAPTVALCVISCIPPIELELERAVARYNLRQGKDIVIGETTIRTKGKEPKVEM